MAWPTWHLHVGVPWPPETSGVKRPSKQITEQRPQEELFTDRGRVEAQGKVVGKTPRLIDFLLLEGPRSGSRFESEAAAAGKAVDLSSGLWKGLSGGGDPPGSTHSPPSLPSRSRTCQRPEQESWAREAVHAPRTRSGKEEDGKGVRAGLTEGAQRSPQPPKIIIITIIIKVKTRAERKKPRDKMAGVIFSLKKIKTKNTR